MRCDRLLGQEIFEFKLNTTDNRRVKNRLDASAMDVTLHE